MEHFKKFLIRLQTFNIGITTRKKNADGYPHNTREVQFYDLSHENPYLSRSFKSEVKELSELAVTDLLNLAPAQITLQLKRLESTKELFRKFWENYYRFSGPVNNDVERKAYFFSWNLDELFIVPNISQDNTVVFSQQFLDDLYDSIQAREEYLKDFERAINQVVPLNEGQESFTISNITKESGNGTPVIKEQVIPDLYTLLKDYFVPEDQENLLMLFQSGRCDTSPLTFNGNGNQLADAFKQLYEANLIVGCNKTGLESWVLRHFLYRDKDKVKNFTEKYLNDIISSDTKSCQSPILNTKKSPDGQFIVVPVQRIKRNSLKY
jgi:hypothetical protein